MAHSSWQWPLEALLPYESSPAWNQLDHVVADFHLHMTGLVLQAGGSAGLAARTAAAQQTVRHAITCWRYVDERHALAALRDAWLAREEWLEWERLRGWADSRAVLVARRAVIEALIAMGVHARNRIRQSEQHRLARYAQKQHGFVRLQVRVHASSRTLRTQLHHGELIARWQTRHLRDGLLRLYLSSCALRRNASLLVQATTLRNVRRTRWAWSQLLALASGVALTSIASQYRQRFALHRLREALHARARQVTMLRLHKLTMIASVCDYAVARYFGGWRDDVLRQRVTERLRRAFSQSRTRSRLDLMWETWRHHSLQCRGRRTLLNVWIQHSLHRVVLLAWRRWGVRAAMSVWWCIANEEANALVSTRRARRALVVLSRYALVRNSLHERMCSVVAAVRHRSGAASEAPSQSTVQILHTPGTPEPRADKDAAITYRALGTPLPQLIRAAAMTAGVKDLHTTRGPCVAEPNTLPAGFTSARIAPTCGEDFDDSVFPQAHLRARHRLPQPRPGSAESQFLQGAYEPVNSLRTPSPAPNFAASVATPTASQPDLGVVRLIRLWQRFCAGALECGEAARTWCAVESLAAVAHQRDLHVALQGWKLLARFTRLRGQHTLVRGNVRRSLRHWQRWAYWAGASEVERARHRAAVFAKESHRCLARWRRVAGRRVVASVKVEFGLRAWETHVVSIAWGRLRCAWRNGRRARRILVLRVRLVRLFALTRWKYYRHLTTATLCIPPTLAMHWKTWREAARRGLLAHLTRKCRMRMGLHELQGACLRAKEAKSKLALASVVLSMRMPSFFRRWRFNRHRDARVTAAWGWRRWRRGVRAAASRRGVTALRTWCEVCLRVTTDERRLRGLLARWRGQVLTAAKRRVKLAFARAAVEAALGDPWARRVYQAVRAWQHEAKLNPAPARRHVARVCGAIVTWRQRIDNWRAWDQHALLASQILLRRAHRGWLQLARTNCRVLQLATTADRLWMRSRRIRLAEAVMSLRTAVERLASICRSIEEMSRWRRSRLLHQAIASWAEMACRRQHSHNFIASSIAKNHCLRRGFKAFNKSTSPTLILGEDALRFWQRRALLSTFHVLHHRGKWRALSRMAVMHACGLLPPLPELARWRVYALRRRSFIRMLACATQFRRAQASIIFFRRLIEQFAAFCRVYREVRVRVHVAIWRWRRAASAREAQTALVVRASLLLGWQRWTRSLQLKGGLARLDRLSAERYVAYEQRLFLECVSSSFRRWQAAARRGARMATMLAVAVRNGNRSAKAEVMCTWLSRCAAHRALSGEASGLRSQRLSLRLSPDFRDADRTPMPPSYITVLSRNVAADALRRSHTLSRLARASAARSNARHLLIVAERIFRSLACGRALSEMRFQSLWARRYRFAALLARDRARLSLAQAWCIWVESWLEDSQYRTSGSGSSRPSACASTACLGQRSEFVDALVSAPQLEQLSLPALQHAWDSLDDRRRVACLKSAWDKWILLSSIGFLTCLGRGRILQLALVRVLHRLAADVTANAAAVHMRNEARRHLRWRHLRGAFWRWQVWAELLARLQAGLPSQRSTLSAEPRRTLMSLRRALARWRRRTVRARGGDVYNAVARCWYGRVTLLHGMRALWLNRQARAPLRRDSREARAHAFNRWAAESQTKIVLLGAARRIVSLHTSREMNRGIVLWRDYTSLLLRARRIALAQRSFRLMSALNTWLASLANSHVEDGQSSSIVSGAHSVGSARTEPSTLAYPTARGALPDNHPWGQHGAARGSSLAFVPTTPWDALAREVNYSKLAIEAENAE